MKNGVPTQWLSTDRSVQLCAGAQVATDLVAAVFPPRGEDPHGDLAVGTVELLSNRALRTVLGDTDLTPAERRWWLEGFVGGYCGQAAATLRRAADDLEVDEMGQLVEMRRAIGARLDPSQAAASETVFAYVEALLCEDEVGAAWALENLFAVPVGASAEELGSRVKHVCSAAVLTCCATWQVLLLGSTPT